MRHFPLLFLAILFTNTALAQSPDAQPEPIGGIEQLDTYVRFNARIPLNYPVVNVTVKGIVQPDGTVTDLQVEQGLDDILNREALRVMRLYRGWKSAGGWARITRGELARLTNLTVRGVEYQLGKLRQANLIERAGATKAGFWKMK